MPKRKRSDIVVSSGGGVMRDLILRIKLIARLMGDRRVNPFVKLLPLASLAYLIWPIDLVPGIALPVVGALDDVALVSLGAYLFIEFCPPDVVQEHMQKLTSNMDVVEDYEDVIDAETEELDEGS